MAAADDDGFLSRWSKRKAAVRSGAALAPEAPPVAVPPPPPPAAVAAPAPAEPEAPREPPPTMADVLALGRDADFSRFVAPDVDGAVKNAALKKLFSDPHFNVMDGLDTYIDDYGIADPIPKSMLRRMVQSQLLGLFRDDDPPPPSALPPALPDEDPDLRLQPHDDAGRDGAEPHAGEDAGREL